jgi:hypothetical protein
VAFGSEQDLAQEIRELLWFAGLCGLSTFALIEILKRLVGVRGMYQRRGVERWLTRANDSQRADTEFYEALGRPNRRALFNLPTEHLAAQISAAADLALTAPKRYPTLFEMLTRRPNLPEPGPTFVSADADADAEDSDRLELAQRARVAVDQLQISLTDGWRRLVQGASLWIAGLLGIILTQASSGDDNSEVRLVLAALLIGGPFAWISRDVSAVLERWRR